MYNYAIRFEQDSAPGLAVFCRDLPELNSYGDDKEHAIREAVDAIETALSIYVDERRAIPQASPAQPGEHVIRLPAVTVAKIVLWNEMMAQDMRKADLCRLLGLAQTQGDRLVDFLHTSKMEAIEDALKPFGVGLSVSREALPSYIEYEVTYSQSGEVHSFRFLENQHLTNEDAWGRIQARLKLVNRHLPGTPSSKETCEAHGVTDAKITYA